MTKALSETTVALVKATIPALIEHGPNITQTMYARLFEDASVRKLFNHANQGEGGAQVHALSAAILAYAQNIDNLGAVLPVVERIAQKHIGYHILPEHYPHVATALLGAIREVLGAAATDEIVTAWGEAYWFLADILMGRESALRAEISGTPGGWTGWRRFVVVDRIQESTLITSFILQPADGGSVIPHKAGQYLTIRYDPEGVAFKRNYSISSGPQTDHYRISVKRESRGNGGSLFLHDRIQIGDVVESTPPAGDFFLDDEPQRPVILLSGGVGLTPMISMVEEIAARHPALRTYYVHGTTSSATHAMDRHVRDLASTHGNIRVHTFYSDPGEGDVAGTTHDEDGFVSIEWLRANAPLAEADVYLCGPKPFLRSFVSGLLLAGVPASRLHYEFFGPADELLAA